MGENTRSGVPQFSTAEDAGKAGETVCKPCAQKISGSYYLLNGAPVCARCARQIEQQLPQDTHASFVRGVLFGVAGALLGLGIYVAFGSMRRRASQRPYTRRK